LILEVIHIKTIKIITLGCKTNFYESSAMAGLLRNAGYAITENDIADIYIINTCTVTNTGASKSRQAIKKCKQANPTSIVAVTGCLAQLDADEIAKIDGVDVVSGVERGNIVELIRDFDVGSTMLEVVQKTQSSVGEALKAPFNKGDAKERGIALPDTYEEISAVDTQSRVRAVVKIQDGCDNYCSYCIIPYARGRARSRKLENIIAEAKALAKTFSEIVITGINLTSYGKDLAENIGLIDVLERLNEIDGIERIRLGSLSPTIVDKAFAERVARLDKLCPQFHLSLQSGCDETLKMMNRKYDTTQYLQAVRLLCENVSDCAITTDLIVGFPGESEEQFEQSYEFCKQIGFSQMHIFKYSKRAGTVAAEMKEQVLKADKQRRSERMLELAVNMKREFYQNYVGEIVDVLFESRKAHETSNHGELGRWHGLTTNYMDVLAQSNADLEGKIKRVKLTAVDFDGENLVGEIIE